MPVQNAPAASSFDRVHAFVKGLDKDARIRGKTGKEAGKVTIFAQSGKTRGSAGERAANLLSGRAKLREAIDVMLKEVEAQAPHSAPLRAATDALREAVSRSRHDIRAEELDRRMDAVADARLAVRVEARPTLGGARAPLVRKQRMDAIARATGKPRQATLMAAHARGELVVPALAHVPGLVAATRDALQDRGTAVGRIAAHLRGTLDQDPGLHFAFAASRGRGLVRELARKVQQDAPPGMSFEELEQLLAQAYSAAVVDVQPHECVRDGNGSLVQVDPLRVDGRTYRLERKLGQGGLGVAFLYKAADGQADSATQQAERIVVKWPLPGGENDTEQTFEEFATEVVMQRMAGRVGENTLGLTGVVRLDEETLGAVMPLAAHGDVEALLERWKPDASAPAPGADGGGPQPLTPDTAARATLLRDMVRGLADLHARGIRHLDFKPGNTFVDSTGTGRIADYGKASLSPTLRMTDSPADAIQYCDPAASSKAFQVKAQRSKESATTSKKLQEIRKHRHVAQLPVKELAQFRAVQAESERVLRGMTYDLATDAYDLWALGATACAMFDNKSPFDFMPGEQFKSDVQARIDAYMAAGPERRLDILFPKDSRVPHELRGPIASLMHPDPAQRMSAQEFANLPFFQSPGIGGDAARQYILAKATA
jgi:serine/threonine protein kinase